MQNFSNLSDIFETKDNEKTLTACYIKTPLDVMMAIGDEGALYLLEFVDNPSLPKNIKNLKKDLDANIIIGNTSPISMIEKELDAYFNGALQIFETPLHLKGTSFQKEVWQALTKIPFGQTKSYLEIAQFVEKPSHFRAVARANSTNKFPIIIPCHRIINANGNLGGYSGGIERKKWLLNHESKKHY